MRKIGRRLLLYVGAPTIATVLGGLILEWFTGTNILTLLWEFIQNLAKSAITILNYQINVPVWGLSILGILILPTLIIVGIIIMASLSRQSPQQTNSDWINYVTDMILDVKWVWDWNQYNREIRYLTPLCPHCRNELTPSDQSRYNQGTFIRGLGFRSLLCDNCGFHRDFGYSIETVFQKVKREIRRRIRTGDYVKSLEPTD